MVLAPMFSAPDHTLPSRQLLETQAEWLRPARARLLRRAGIAHRRRVLEIGSGYGAVTRELISRARGEIVALDRSAMALSHVPDLERTAVVQGKAQRLPFRSNSFDLIFGQHLFMWLSRPVVALTECVRVLGPGGVAVLIEPDYGGMIEYPAAVATQPFWLAALERAGADPRAGRRLPALCAEVGLRTRVFLLEEIRPPEAQRFQLLEQLPLTEAERREIQGLQQRIAMKSEWQRLVHLPYMLVLAEKAAG